MRDGFKAVVLGTVLTVGLTFGAAAQDAEIEAIINSQFEAFKVDDFAEAFQYATPDLQRLFQSPQNFERMVMQGYPMVWRPGEVRYLELSEKDGAMWQKVQVTDSKGATHYLGYRMEQTAAGWRIGGVQILQAPDASV